MILWFDRTKEGDTTGELSHYFPIHLHTCRNSTQRHRRRQRDYLRGYLMQISSGFVSGRPLSHIFRYPDAPLTLFSTLPRTFPIYVEEGSSCKLSFNCRIFYYGSLSGQCFSGVSQFSAPHEFDRRSATSLRQVLGEVLHDGPVG